MCIAIHALLQSLLQKCIHTLDSVSKRMQVRLGALARLFCIFDRSVTPGIVFHYRQNSSSDIVLGCIGMD